MRTKHGELGSLNDYVGQSLCLFFPCWTAGGKEGGRERGKEGGQEGIKRTKEREGGREESKIPWE